MKYLLLAVLLTGCSTVVPVTVKFPEAPQPLLEPCKQLQPVSESATLSELTRTVVRNYSYYHDCKIMNESWQEWYLKQKQIFEGLK